MIACNWLWHHQPERFLMEDCRKMCGRQVISQKSIHNFPLLVGIFPWCHCQWLVCELEGYPLVHKIWTEANTKEESRLSTSERVSTVLHAMEGRLWGIRRKKDQRMCWTREFVDKIKFLYKICWKMNLFCHTRYTLIHTIVVAVCQYV